MKNYPKILLFAAFILSCTFSSAQVWDPVDGCLKEDENGECLSNTLLTAVPFLRINPDARTGAMGDVGIAIDADASAMHFNASKLAFASNDLSFSATYSPWLNAIGLRDVYLAYLSGYKRINEVQTIGFDLRFFSLGTIDFTDVNGNPTGQGSPREFAVSFAYARKLSERLAAGLTAKYIYSNLASNQQVNGIQITAANTFAVDLSFKYHHDVKVGKYDGRFNYGLAVTNLGAKVTYTRELEVRDFIPSNLGFGTAFELDIDDYNSFTFALDINKLLVPTPISTAAPQEEWDANGNNIPDFREKNLIEGIAGSFNDAPGGLSEEFNELYYSLGIEYWYDKQFAVRAGYYYEHQTKGDRQFLTLGFGLKYNTLGMNISYLVPTTIQRSPLDNTLRFGFSIDLGEEYEE
jgi:hypothetical protein